MTAASSVLFQPQIRALRDLRALAEGGELWAADRVTVNRLLVEFADLAAAALEEAARRAEMTSRYREEQAADLAAMAAATKRLQEQQARDFELMEKVARSYGVLPAPSLPN